MGVARLDRWSGDRHAYHAGDLASIARPHRLSCIWDCSVRTPRTSGDEPLAGHSARLERALRAQVAHPAQSQKGATGLMETATDGLRKRVMKVKGH